jgi:UDP-glucose 4-epimerase
LQHISDGNYDCVFHLAALPSVPYSIDNPEHSFDVNVSRTISLIEACRRAKVKKFVFSSSAAVYGDGGRRYYSHNGISESDAKFLKSPYAWHKLSVEQYLQMLQRLHGFQSVSLRYFNVYGPGQFGGTPYSNAISAWCHCLKNGLPLRSDGDGKQSRDMVHIDNIVQANILAMDSRKSNIYNIGLGLEYSNESIIKYFNNNFPNISVVQAPERLGDVKHTKANINLAQCELGYKPLVGFWEGLNSTWEWWGLKLKRA